VSHPFCPEQQLLARNEESGTRSAKLSFVANSSAHRRASRESHSKHWHKLSLVFQTSLPRRWRAAAEMAAPRTRKLMAT